MHHRAIIEFRPDPGRPGAMHLLAVSGTVEDAQPAYLTHVNVVGDSSREDILGAFSLAAQAELAEALAIDYERLREPA